ncbi:MAG: hypothetical protein D6753_04995 [Planctomycetota bacterium]|nr:MAG: hypothetical protein D6753_04995 [Planctomycetota bacterium]
MTNLFLAVTLLLAVFAQADDDQKKRTRKQTPKDAVEAINKLLAKKEFRTLYRTYCHKYLRDQIGEAEFIEFMKGEPGAAIVQLFAEVQKAIKDKNGKDVLIARRQERKDEYEFILVQVKQMPSRPGQQWHLELKKEDGKWKLLDTD